MKPGDSILIGRKPTGTLLVPTCTRAATHLLGTGTGLAPWLAVIKDPETWERFERVVLCHGVRGAEDLAYRDYIEREFAAALNSSATRSAAGCCTSPRSRASRSRSPGATIAAASPRCSRTAASPRRSGSTRSMPDATAR